MRILKSWTTAILAFVLLLGGVALTQGQAVATSLPYGVCLATIITYDRTGGVSTFTPAASSVATYSVVEQATEMDGLSQVFSVTAAAGYNVSTYSLIPFSGAEETGSGNFVRQNVPGGANHIVRATICVVSNDQSTVPTRRTTTVPSTTAPPTSVRPPLPEPVRQCPATLQVRSGLGLWDVARRALSAKLGHYAANNRLVRQTYLRIRADNPPTHRGRRGAYYAPGDVINTSGC